MSINDGVARMVLQIVPIFAASVLVSKGRVPDVSYITAIDVCMGICNTFMFVALIECIAVTYFWQNQHKTSKRSNAVNTIDKSSRIMFPVTFVLFNKSFWWYYHV